MGRKLAPLRKLFAQTGKDSSNPPDRSQLGKRLPAVATGIGSGTNDRPSRTKKNKSEEKDDDVDWEKIEAEQQNAEGDDSDSEEDDDSDEEGGIRLDGSLEHEVEDYTFEFNDMRDEYSEGICTMLRKFIANPTDAYSLATVVTSQTIVGTVVNCEDGQDSFAFATVLPFHKLEKVASMKAITEHLATGLDKLLHGASNEEVQLLRDCLSVPAASSADKPAVSGTKSPKGASVHASRTGLLLHKRFTNLPLQLVGALHRNLEEDVSWAQQQATDDDEMAQEDYISSSNSSNSSTKNKATKGTNFFAEARNVILLCECEVSKDGKSAFAFPEPSSCYSVLGSCSDIVFSCFEDEVYLQHATAAVLFRPPKSLCGTELVALLVPISKLQKCATGICDLLPA